MNSQNYAPSLPEEQPKVIKNPGGIRPLGTEHLPRAPRYPGPGITSYKDERGLTVLVFPRPLTPAEVARNATITALHARACARVTRGAIRQRYIAQAEHFARAARAARATRPRPRSGARIARRASRPRAFRRGRTTANRGAPSSRGSSDCEPPPKRRRAALASSVESPRTSERRAAR